MTKENISRKKRVVANIPLTWKTSVASTILNISEGGVFFKSPYPLPVGGQLQLEFALPSSNQPIQTTGTVRWVSSHSREGELELIYSVGLAFDALEQAQTEAIRAFVSQKSGEQRRSSRFPMRIVVEYFFAGESYRTIANDISRHGMFLVTQEPLQLNDILHIKFQLPETQALIKVKGVVRWRHDSIPETLSEIVTPGMGVEWTNISPQDQVLIEEFLSYHQSFKQKNPPQEGPKD